MNAHPFELDRRAAWLKSFVFGVIALAFLADPAAAAPVATPHATTELVATTTTATPGAAFQVAVAQTFDKGWHSYWRNPGDAGEATTIRWTLPAGWAAGPIAWPAPRRLPVGPIMNYGYEGGVVLPVSLRVPADARAGSRVTLSAVVDFLVCAEVCVPDTATVSLTVPVATGSPSPDPIWAPRIDAALAAGPKTGALAALFTTQGGRLRLGITGAALAGGKDTDAYFYPYDDKLIDHAKPQTVERGPGGLTLTLSPGTAFDKGATPGSVAGVLEVDGRAFEISAAAGALPASARGLGAPGAPRTGGLGLPLAALFAFLGGLILNLMPCVFPILSMKAAALAGHGGEAKGARRQALAFLVGVMAAFLTLAGLLIAARAAGGAVGWGFQLQSPKVVVVLSLVILAAALNLSGLFEIGTSAQGLGSGLASRSDLLGSAFTGVLAVVVAAPCTAPFMGTALGFALTQGWATALMVFAALGLGFAAPFTLLAFIPPLTRLLPRPGAWMGTFKQALAFPMYAAAAWLVWVLAQQTNAEGLARALAAAVLLSLATWLVGGAQRRSGLGTSGRAWWALGALATALCVGVALWGAYPASAAQAQTSGGALAAQPWSPDRLAAIRAQGRPVLVNFTAAWCVTCQVNERAAFSTREVAQAFRRSGAAYLVADWTNHNAAIAQALAAQGRVGVPLYLVYGAGGAEPKTLPQLLTPGIVAGALDQAAANR